MKIFRISFLIVLLGLGALSGYVFFLKPVFQPIAHFKIQTRPEQVERGRYLANHVMVCIDCHSTRDWTKFSGPVISGTEGKGGEKFDETVGVPGVVYASNITPQGIPHYSDVDLLRAFTTGVKANGEPIFPIMPYGFYGKMTREDAEAIIDYLRNLPPIENKVPQAKINFPMNLIMRFIPQYATLSPPPEENNPVALGKYLANVAGCIECHTEQDHGKPLPGKTLAGNFAFQFPGGTVRSANITPDIETGIGSWTEDQFLSKFKTATASPTGQNDFNTPMPWMMYQGMRDSDLKSIFQYLKTTSPVKQAVVKWSPKT